MGHPGWNKGSIIWREGGPFYLVLGKVYGEPKAIVVRCNELGERDSSLEALIISTKEAEQLGYMELGAQ